MFTKETLDTLIALGARDAKIIQQADSVPLLALPSGQQVVSLESYFPPTRIKREVVLLEASSFIDYTNRFKTANTLIFAKVSETGVELCAMLDYHGAAPDLKPAYCDHLCKFTAIETPEWKIWKGANRVLMDQVKFATWLEDNLSLFVEPKGADLLELVRSLHGHKNARFNNSVRLQTGAYSVTYDEDVVVKSTSSTNSGDLELPPTIGAGISVFQGSQPYEVVARLKCRCDDRKLILFFETVAMHQIIRESIMALVKQIADGTKIVPLLGNP